MKELQIASGFSLPVEAVTQTFAILAKRGAGKSYTASVMVEEMLERQLQAVVIDPLGVWYGLQSSASGKADGYPITVLGGDHGDVPLEPGAGEVIAKFVVDTGQSVILDLSRFRKAEQVRFVTQFCEALYRLNREPLHLVVDEADLFAPQSSPKGYEAVCLGAMEDLARRGRARGIGMTLVTQRSAVLNKNVLTQIEVLIVMRTTSPQDRKAIKAWVDVHGEDDAWELMDNDLPKLPIGTAYIWSPGWLDVFEKVSIRERKTFDSSATPKVGEIKIEPKRRAKPDLKALEEAISDTIEKAKREDPKLLQGRVRELEAQVIGLENRPPPDPVIQEVEVPYLPPAVRKSIEDLLNRIASKVAELAGSIEGQTNSLLTALDSIPEKPESKIGPTKKAETIQQPQLEDQRQQKARPVSLPGDPDLKLARAPRALLEVLIQRMPMKMTRSQLSTLSGYKPKSSTYANALSTLRVNGLMDEEGSGKSALLTASQAGIDLLGGAVPPPQSQEEIRTNWLSNLPAAPSTILAFLLGCHGPVDRETIAQNTDYSTTSSTFANALSTLRTNGLIEDHPGKMISASPNL